MPQRAAQPINVSQHQRAQRQRRQGTLRGVRTSMAASMTRSTLSKPSYVSVPAPGSKHRSCAQAHGARPEICPAVLLSRLLRPREVAAAHAAARLDQTAMQLRFHTVWFALTCFFGKVAPCATCSLADPRGCKARLRSHLSDGRRLPWPPPLAPCPS